MLTIIIIICPFNNMCRGRGRSRGEGPGKTKGVLLADSQTIGNGTVDRVDSRSRGRRTVDREDGKWSISEIGWTVDREMVFSI